MTSETTPADSTRRKSVKLCLKVILTTLVLAFVGHRSWLLLKGQDLSSISVCPGWLAASAACYALGWLPSIWFWRSLLVSLEQKPDWMLCGKAYFAGHMGKYIPGKAGVLIIRSALLKEKGFRFGASVLTAAYETLMMMGVGLVVAGSLAPLLVPNATLNNHLPWAVGLRWLPAAILTTTALLAIPLITWLLSWVAGKFNKSDGDLKRISPRQLLQGYAVFLISWTLLGLSLGAVLQSLSDDWLSLSDLPLWIAAISASTVIGFFAIFTPGGLGVRELVMMEVLRIQPDISADHAALASLILRVVWLLTEAGGFCLFALIVRYQTQHSVDVTTNETDNL